MADIPLLIAGLGNPGAEYARNRHNIGFMVADVLADRQKFGPWRKRFQSHIAEGTLAGRKIYLLKPQTYMNDSGLSVSTAMQFYKLPLSALVVIHDEIDLPAGKLKMKTGGGDAGNNGLRSITAAMGSEYRRVRIGIGHPGEKHRVSDHVLGNFSKSDEDWLVLMLGAVADASPYLARNDDPGFMNRVALLLHPPEKKPKPEKDV